jgi:hypothetical protein
VGVEVVERGGSARRILVGPASGQASGWATYLATPDAGTPGTGYSYSTATRGVIVDGRVIILDVVAGADRLGLAGS